MTFCYLLQCCGVRWCVVLWLALVISEARAARNIRVGGEPDGSNRAIIIYTYSVLLIICREYLTQGCQIVQIACSILLARILRNITHSVTDRVVFKVFWSDGNSSGLTFLTCAEQGRREGRLGDEREQVG